MRFRLTARDNRAGGGGVCFDSTSIKVDATAAPFVVTYPTATGVVWYVNDFKTVTWNTSTTAVAPIGAANVTIQLSLDGGNTYPVTLLASTPNDGTEEIQVPNNLTSSARIRVMALGNVFYDLSNNNFTIQASPSADFVLNNPVPVATCGATNPTAIIKTAALNNFSASVSLSATGVPAGTTVSFSPTQVAANGTSTITLNNANTLPAGNYDITVTGTSAGFSDKSRVITFVAGNSAAAPSPVAPANYAIGLVTKPTFSWSAIPAAITYTLEISTLADFSVIAQSISGITITSTTISTDLTQNTNYYWRVKTVNSCGTGSASAAFMFKTAQSVCTNFASTNVPRTISASGTPTVTSTLVIPAGSGVTISDLNVVGLIGTHTWTADLTATLRSPARNEQIQNVNKFY